MVGVDHKNYPGSFESTTIRDHVARLTWRQRLRAWLIGIVREAIRAERDADKYPQGRPVGYGGVPLTDKAIAYDRQNKPPVFIGDFSLPNEPHTASKTVTATTAPVAEKTFEQFQDESIAEQANFYAPKEQP